jgi:hypothetical protein
MKTGRPIFYQRPFQASKILNEYPSQQSRLFKQTFAVFVPFPGVTASFNYQRVIF